MAVCREFESAGNVTHVGFVSTALLDSYVYNVVYRISLFIGVQYVLPTVALVYLNSRVIVALRRSDTYRQSTTHARHPAASVVTRSSSSSQSTRSITTVVAVIVSICIVVHLVALTAHLVATIQVVTSRRITCAHHMRCHVRWLTVVLAHRRLSSVSLRCWFK